MSDDFPCAWAPLTDDLYRTYHDTEWGVPEYDGRALVGEAAAGRHAGRPFLDHHSCASASPSARSSTSSIRRKLARWTPKRAGKALKNPGIIRSPKKIEAVIGNAQAYLAMEESGEGFADYCWGFVGGAPIVNKWKHFRQAPTSTDWSAAMSKDLKKRGFKFVGPTIVYAWAQAVGMVNDHDVTCPRHREVQEMAS